jgi:hypothetical protein
MAINYFEMLGSLRMGVDFLPDTDPETVPHATQPGYVPRYTLRRDDGSVVMEGQVDELVHEAHVQLVESLTLYEDEYPVFTVN